jgi:SAM-dependent methyltransferase
MPFEAFAAAFASGDERKFSEGMAEFALQSVRARGVTVESVLDVGSGTGAACEYFNRAGLRVVGVDVSATNIELADEAAKRKGLAVDYRNEDVVSMAPPGHYDLVTAMYDMVNMFPDDASFTAAVGAIGRAVRAGGFLVFDVYTRAGVHDSWGERLEVHTANRDHYVITQTRWDESAQTGIKDFVGFARDGDRWVRWEETHITHALERVVVESAIEQAGFRLTDVFGWSGGEPGAPHAGSGRLVFFAQAR